MILNAEKRKFKDLWTRQQVEEKSVIDYVIANKENIDTVKSVMIDQERNLGTYRAQSYGKKRMHSYHNSILTTIDYESMLKPGSRGKIITNSGYKKLQ